MSEQVVEVDRAPRLERLVVVAQHVEHLAAPVGDLFGALLDVALGGLDRGCLRHQAPEELHVQVALRALDGAVMQLPRGERVELGEGGHAAEVIRGPGAPKRNPWASVQPRSASRIACSSCSTPSPIASIPSACDSETIAATIAVSPGELPSAATNDRSILTAWTGRSRSDE